MALPDAGAAPHAPVSAAYKAGAAHGTALANAHAATDYSPYVTAAHTAAAGDIQPTIDAIVGQQHQIQADAANQARQIGAASNAAAGMDAGIAPATLASYRQGAQDLINFAHGFQGNLQNTAVGDATAAAAALRNIGAPAGQMPTGAQGQALGNVLYGLGGVIPANVLETSGLAQAGAQRQLPSTTRAYGEQQALGALGAGSAAAGKLGQQIINAKAGEGAVAQKYLTQFLNANTAKQKQDALNAWRESQATSLADYRTRTLGLATTKANNDAIYKQAYLTHLQNGESIQQAHNAAMESVANYNAKTGRINATKPSTSNIKTIGGRIVRVNPNGTVDTLYTAPKSVKGTQTSDFPNLTKAQVIHLRSGLASAYYGVPEQKDVAGKVTRVALPPVDYFTAIDEAVKSGYSRAGATKMANRFYAPGTRGRPGGAAATPTWGGPTSLIGG